MDTDRQPWDAEREKLLAQADEIYEAFEYVLSEFRRLRNLPPSEAECPQVGDLRDALGLWADSTIDFLACLRTMPHRVKMAMIIKLKNATSCFPWH